MILAAGIRPKQENADQVDFGLGNQDEGAYNARLAERWQSGRMYLTRNQA